MGLLYLWSKGPISPDYRHPGTQAMQTLGVSNLLSQNVVVLTSLGILATFWCGYSPAAQPEITPPVLDPASDQPLTAQHQPSSTLNTVVQPPTETNVVFVNPVSGEDTTGDGSLRSPWKTITQALEEVPANTLIRLAAGTYSAESGEQFPLIMRSGVSIQGDADTYGDPVLIRGGGEWVSLITHEQNVAIIGADQATLTGVTVENPNRHGHGLWIESSSPTVVNNTFRNNAEDGVQVIGNSSPLIHGNRFVQNQRTGLTVMGPGQADIRQNQFEQTGIGINIDQNATPRLINNHIVNNRDGMVIQGQARPVLRDNYIENNQRDGIRVLDEAWPDLGTASTPGNNQFRNNRRYHIHAEASPHSIPAYGNQIPDAQTIGQLDFSSRASRPAEQLIAVETPIVDRPASSPYPVHALLDHHDVERNAADQVTSAPVDLDPSTQQGLSVEENEPIQIPRSLYHPSRPSASSIRSSGEQTVQLSASSSSRVEATPPSPSQSTSAATDEAIEIPVPPPISSRNRTASTAAVQIPVPLPPASQSSLEEPIEIPVPPPISTRPSSITRQPASTPSEPQALPPAPSSTPSPETPSSLTRSNNLLGTLLRAASRPTPTPTPTPTPQGNLLPVPGANIPQGYVGDLPRVTVYGDPSRYQTSATLSGSRPARPSGLRYRVVVEAGDERIQNYVRALIPGAFYTYVNGQAVMQAGAFSSLENANEAARLLANSGLRVAVQQID